MQYNVWGKSTVCYVKESIDEVLFHSYCHKWFSHLNQVVGFSSPKTTNYHASLNIIVNAPLTLYEALLCDPKSALTLLQGEDICGVVILYVHHDIIPLYVSPSMGE